MDATFLSEPTILLLGAGASKPYGFPLGSELRNLLVGSHNDTIEKIVREHGFDAGTVNEFKEALRYSDHPTMDIFLEKKLKFRKIGSYFIAGDISATERQRKPRGRSLIIELTLRLFGFKSMVCQEQQD